MQGYKIIIKY